ncbi:MAG TPA: CsbD family protein [Brevundimonas sp.]|jgi:uncharacterized protein YjbJ (UPF0337 family)|uniref:CsbD family protein n=1 Tax=Brevundimonas sp. TaxID=1871086 RepID=UPI002DF25458|nr:CsbD family protein [Brevundimonas sp.]
MTDQRILGSTEQGLGKAQAGLGKLTGDAKLRLDGRVTEFRGQARDAYGRVVDGIEGLVAKAPAEYQEYGRRGIDFARRKPLLTTGIVAGLAIVLGGLGRRR